MINLLDDPDDSVYDQVCRELLELGDEAVPFLENAWETSFNAILQRRIESIIHQINFQSVLKNLKAWRDSEEKSLLEAAIIIARFQYSDLDENHIREFIAQLTQDVWIELNQDYTAMEKAGIFNKVFFEIYGFGGNKKSFHSPRNCFINNVLESRKGNPLSLSMLYIEVARRLKVPIYGIDLPEHFVLGYTRLPIQFIEEVKKEDVLFYINPFNQGTLFQHKDIDQFIKQLKIEKSEHFYLPCDHMSMICRMIMTLIVAYHKAGYEDKVDELKLMYKCLRHQNDNS
ncbi:MAG: transglutaminase-like domain-containing protein [Vicingaceae bacterium]